MLYIRKNRRMTFSSYVFFIITASCLPKCVHLLTSRVDSYRKKSLRCILHKICLSSTLPECVYLNYPLMDIVYQCVYQIPWVMFCTWRTSCHVVRLNILMCESTMNLYLKRSLVCIAGGLWGTRYWCKWFW